MLYWTEYTMNKSGLRAFARSEKTKVDFKAVSVSVCNKISELDEYKSAKNVLLYYALPDEVSLDILIYDLERRNVCCVLPVVDKDTLILKKYDGASVTGAFGISEPTGDTVEPSSIDFAVIPGVMFDKSRNRLGRGKGFYDRLLPLLNCKTAGVCPDNLLIDNIAHEKHDIPVHMVVTDKRVV